MALKRSSSWPLPIALQLQVLLRSFVALVAPKDQPLLVPHNWQHQWYKGWWASDPESRPAVAVTRQGYPALVKADGVNYNPANVQVKLEDIYRYLQTTYLADLGLKLNPPPGVAVLLPR